MGRDEGRLEGAEDAGKSLGTPKFTLWEGRAGPRTKRNEPGEAQVSGAAAICSQLLSGVTPESSGHSPRVDASEPL